MAGSPTSEGGQIHPNPVTIPSTPTIHCDRHTMLLLRMLLFLQYMLCCQYFPHTYTVSTYCCCACPYSCSICYAASISLIHTPSAHMSHILLLRMSLFLQYMLCCQYFCHTYTISTHTAAAHVAIPAVYVMLPVFLSYILLLHMSLCCQYFCYTYTISTHVTHTAAAHVLIPAVYVMLPVFLSYIHH